MGEDGNNEDDHDADHEDNGDNEGDGNNEDDRDADHEDDGDNEADADNIHLAPSSSASPNVLTTSDEMLKVDRTMGAAFRTFQSLAPNLHTLAMHVVALWKEQLSIREVWSSV